MRLIYLIGLLLGWCSIAFALDPGVYAKKKAGGFVSIKKSAIDKSFLVSEKQFNPETGAALDDRVSDTTLQSLADRKKQLQDEIAAIDLLVADLKALP